MTPQDVSRVLVGRVLHARGRDWPGWAQVVDAPPSAVHTLCAAACTLRECYDAILMRVWLVICAAYYDTPVGFNARIGLNVPVFQIAQEIPLPAYNYTSGAGGPAPEPVSYHPHLLIHHMTVCIGPPVPRKCHLASSADAASGSRGGPCAAS